MKRLQKYIEKLDANNGIPTPEIVASIMKDAETIFTEAKRRWDWYEGPGAPILTRPPKGNQIDNRVNSAFPARIVNTKAGYLYGQPQTVSLDGEYPEEDGKLIKDFRFDNDMSDLDTETGKAAAACGYAGRLLQIVTDPETNGTRVKALLVEPWLCGFLTDGEIYSPAYSFRYWIEERDNMAHVIVVRFYTPTNVFQFEGDVYGRQLKAVGNPAGEVHGFIGVPLIGYANNRELRHDYYLAEEKIKAYERCVSNLDSELENERLGYLILQDVEVSTEERERFKKTGALQVTSSGQREAKIYFLEKHLDPTIYEAHLNRLTEDINLDTGHVDWTDEQFGSGIAGVALRYKLTPLENKSIIAQEKHMAADRQMYWLLCGYWAVKTGRKIDYRDIKAKWTRNLPPNVAEEVQNVVAAKGVFSDETAYSLAPSVVEDPKKEKEAFDNDNPVVQLTGNVDGQEEDKDQEDKAEIEGFKA